MSGIPDALIVTRGDIGRVMRPADYVDAVELAFRAAAVGKASTPPPMHLPATHGNFHGKGATIALGRDYAAVKVNGNFPGNPARRGLPTIQGAILLFDGSNGSLLAILDSIEVTIQRTAATSALAAKLLARPTSSSLLICGCGEQGRAHAAMLRAAFPVERCLFWDRDPARSLQLAAELGGEAVEQLDSATGCADLTVTCTTATEPFLDAAMVRPGTFIAAVGADNETKSEISPALMAAARVVTDVTAQCAAMGDLHHAIAAGVMTEAGVHAELAQLVVGKPTAMQSPDEIIVFDSTGTGLQDVAAAAAIYERCIAIGGVTQIALADN